ncbi:MAG: hypothetical protein KJ712_06405 [Bacteroidetes bacterium]|nr:hypothetical protein [Bacteroidota bacterium]MBU1483947.1 hypothetical protein [Bacteroidota bacterium]MBU1761939.1 hypothetical protein [Bacteroidota bacterium]MBU2046344.1 hypothetical protein [Bacteroidota bacterium]MBU2374552.1 hypothetical protein [Bacteroidota bacterium]
MSRGQNSLFTSLFPSSIPVNPDNKGKRNSLIDKRDEALIFRYYYHAEIKRTRYDDCLTNLEKEFFITAGVITQRITLNVDTLKKIVAQKASAYQLKKKFPHFDWN